jgi:hypothetical protein
LSFNDINPPCPVGDATILVYNIEEGVGKLKKNTRYVYHGVWRQQGLPVVTSNY